MLADCLSCLVSGERNNLSGIKIPICLLSAEWTSRCPCFSMWTPLYQENSARSSFCCSKYFSSPPELLMPAFVCAVDVQAVSVPCLDAGQWNWEKKNKSCTSQLAECLLYLIPSARAFVNHSMLLALDTWPISYLVFGNILVIPWSFHRLKSRSQWGQSSPVCDPVCAWPPGSTATWSAASSSERQGAGITDQSTPRAREWLQIAAVLPV